MRVQKTKGNKFLKNGKLPIFALLLLLSLIFSTINGIFQYMTKSAMIDDR